MLLEVIIATAVIATAMFAILDSLGGCIAAARSVQNTSLVETLLANKAGEFRTERATDYLDQEGPFEGRTGFTWDRKFEATDSEGLWKQTITVYWHERGKLVSDSITEYRYLPQKDR